MDRRTKGTPVQQRAWRSDLPRLHQEIELLLPVIRKPRWTAWKAAASRAVVVLAVGGQVLLSGCFRLGFDPQRDASPRADAGLDQLPAAGRDLARDAPPADTTALDAPPADTTALDAPSADTTALDAPPADTTPTVDGPALPAHQWAWVGGVASLNGKGSHGTKGVAAPSNLPGARRFAAYWIDAAGRLWLFGGDGYDSVGTKGKLSDLWRYNPKSARWIWIGGPKTSGQQGSWGTKGVASSTNWPSARASGSFAADPKGHLWLLGGSGIDAGGKTGYLADLWRYDVASGMWAWTAGTNLADQAPVFGNLKQASASSRPGQKIDGALWLDGSGKVWHFGGSEPGWYMWRNDLWRYDPSSGWWTWMGGHNTAASYGTLGAASATNVPGRRFTFGYGVDPAGVFWVFGGEGRDATGKEWALNDLWRLDPKTAVWTWISGATTVGSKGVYGAKGVAAPGNVVGSRTVVRLTPDPKGRLWVHGGYGPVAVGDRNFNDLWRFDPQTGQWTWIAGGSAGDEAGVYGVMGLADPNNAPGARDGHGLWCDGSGTIWIFGGRGRDGAGQVGMLSDLWRIATQ